jgi:cyanophycin synthetase
VIAKPNDGSRGNLVEMPFDAQELASYLERAARQTNSVLIQRPVALPEYRIFLLEGEIRYLYRRERGGLRGDGKSTVRRLLEAHNRTALGTGLSEVPEGSRYLRHHLEQAGLGLDDVLPAGGILSCAPNANISGGGQIHGFSRQASAATRDWARCLHAALPLAVMGVDVFAADIDAPDGFVVCEVNGNPSVKGLDDIGERETIIQLWMDICRMGMKAAP